MEDHGFSLEMERDENFRFTVTFDDEGLPPLLLDEPVPLGDGAGPNAARILGAAVGNCLSASLLFCLRKAHLEPSAIRTTVEGRILRNDKGRMRLGTIKVRIHPTMNPEDQNKIGRCLGLFEEFCIVTQSVRDGIDVDVSVVPETREEAVAVG
jgi:organic hydroperoxide reductase OsmC/OhrA